MHDIMVTVPIAWVYFVMYQMFVSSLLFELLTAIVLDNFRFVEGNRNWVGGEPPPHPSSSPPFLFFSLDT